MWCTYVNEQYARVSVRVSVLCCMIHPAHVPLQAVEKRPELKLIVTSATLDAVKFSSYFFEAVSATEWG